MSANLDLRPTDAHMLIGVSNTLYAAWLVEAAHCLEEGIPFVLCSDGCLQLLRRAHGNEQRVDEFNTPRSWIDEVCTDAVTPGRGMP